MKKLQIKQSSIFSKKADRSPNSISAVSQNNQNKNIKTSKIKETTYSQGSENSSIISDSFQKFKKTDSRIIHPQAIMKPSSSRIYKKYISVENIFYQERQQLTILKRYTMAIIVFSLIWLFLAITIYMLSFIQGHSGKCPQNADCGVYIWCHQGYQLIGESCKVNKDIKQKAEYICKCVSDQLNKQYGGLDCEDQLQQLKQIPKTYLAKVYDDYGIESQIIKNEMKEYFSLPKNQKQLGIMYFSSTNSIYADSKKYTLTCSAFLYFVNGNFAYHLAILLICSGLFFWYYRRCAIKQQVKNRYNQFKSQIDANGVVNISELKKSCHLSISKFMWDQIQKYRFQQRQLGYYEQNGSLYWCRV